MKITLKLTTLIFCFFSVLNLAQEKQAEIKFETNSIDYGQIDYESDGTKVFKFKNIGDAPLIFTRISSSCGCTVPKKPEKPIQPGAEGQIEVNYDTKRVGIFRKAVTRICFNIYTIISVLPTKSLQICRISRFKW